MRCDDGRCHICRREPLEQDENYTITTCKSCDETAGIVRAKRQAERKPALNDETVFSRAVALSFLDAFAAVVVFLFVLMQAFEIGRGGAPWSNWFLIIGLVWALHAIIKPRPL